MGLLVIDDVKKSYGKQPAIKGISLELPEGACFGLVGPNGAGKSTLLKIIAAIIRDYSGSVRFEKKRTRIGYVPQEIALEETLTARDNLIFFGKLHGLKGKKLQQRITEVLKEIGLESRAKDKVMTFSGGMKRRLNIGCAILHQPELIIMDEPTVGIDPQSRKYIFEMIERFKAAGRTIIYASHYMEEVEQLCDEAAFMDHGEVIETGSLNTILLKHAIPSVFVKGEKCFPNHMEKYGVVLNKDGGFLVKTDEPLLAMEQFLHFSKEQNSRIERLELVQPRLEDVFFTLTGKQLRD